MELDVALRQTSFLLFALAMGAATNQEPLVSMLLYCRKGCHGASHLIEWSLERTILMRD